MDYGFDQIQKFFLDKIKSVWNFSGKDILSEWGIDITSNVDFETLEAFGRKIRFLTDYYGDSSAFLSKFTYVPALISKLILVQAEGMPVDSDIASKETAEILEASA